jgi:predicted kinase
VNSYTQRLFIPIGVPGAGKTTVCQLISDITGAKHIWVDYERKMRVQSPEYTHHENKALYDQLNKDVERHLKEGASVVYDTAFNYYHDRQLLRSIADRYSCDLVVVWIQTPLDIARKRAVHTDDISSTRVLGAMSKDDFNRLSQALEKPRTTEHAISIDGSHVTRSVVEQLLVTLDARQTN